MPHEIDHLGSGRRLRAWPNTVSRYETYIAVFLRESGFDVRPLAAADERDVDRFVNPICERNLWC